ncbi:6897_t:CDS:2 [Diversispora eburnea]|uniref:6897_t:CDS:1 n=1 Tax=Diversispora eburnea TaxID=1213867 RepID=A0A9N8YJ97_9GLOM|nr:6897_t:CDS:2 [Diversispora eburnea]
MIRGMNAFKINLKKLIQFYQFSQFSFGYSTITNNFSHRNCLSKTFLPTTKDVSSSKDDTVKGESHQLMIRAGLIRQSSSGVYSLLPFALRSLEKLEKIVDQEMKNIGGQKLSLPILLSANTWKKTGRWETAGAENNLLRYIISGRKYRDEMRPRSGLLRGREFIMKDLYTFDTTEELALKTYEEVIEAYKKILKNIGLPFSIADADTGNIGGLKSHEFHFLSGVGEDLILSCSRCGYSSNEERAIGIIPVSNSSDLNLDKIPSIRYGIDKDQRLSAIILGNERELNALKLKAHLGKNQIEILPKDIQELPEIDEILGLDLYVDKTFSLDIPDLDLLMKNKTINNNNILPRIIQKLNQKSQSEGTIKIYQGDFHNTKSCDGCPVCYNNDNNLTIDQNFHPLISNRAIEIGHTFLLGTKYSEPLKATYAIENFKSPGELLPIQMGCYGLGISRIFASIIEISHDRNGIIWPISVAPYKVCIIQRTEDSRIIEMTRSLYDLLNLNCEGLNGEVIIDDRINLSFGYRIKDAELVGYPWVIVLGNKYLENNKIEINERCNKQRNYIEFEKIKESKFWL